MHEELISSLDTHKIVFLNSKFEKISKNQFNSNKVSHLNVNQITEFLIKDFKLKVKNN